MCNLCMIFLENTVDDKRHEAFLVSQQVRAKAKAKASSTATPGACPTHSHTLSVCSGNSPMSLVSWGYNYSHGNECVTNKVLSLIKIIQFFFLLELVCKGH